MTRLKGRSRGSARMTLSSRMKSSVQSVVVKMGTQLLSDSAKRLDVTFLGEMASQVVDEFAGPEAKHDRTSIIPLPGGERPLDEVRVEATEVIDDAVVVEHLIRSYGTRWRDVWLLAEDDPVLKQRVSPSHAVIGAEFVYAMQREFALTLGDLLIRRTHLAFEMPDQARSVAEDLATILGDGDIDARRREYEAEVQRTFETQ